MPIVQPRSFDSLGLIPFQISPHYQDPDPTSKHMGETQEERILQFLEENETPVVGMREGAWLLVENDSVKLKGEPARAFFAAANRQLEAIPVSEISRLVGAANAIKETLLIATQRMSRNYSAWRNASKRSKKFSADREKEKFPRQKFSE